MIAHELPSVGRVYNQLRLQSTMLSFLLKLARSLLKLKRDLLKLTRCRLKFVWPVRTFACLLMNLIKLDKF